MKRTTGRRDDRGRGTGGSQWAPRALSSPKRVLGASLIEPRVHKPPVHAVLWTHFMVVAGFQSGRPAL